MKALVTVLAAVLASGPAAGVTIAEINGNRFLSPLCGHAVANVTGLVTAVAPNGVFLRSTEPDDDATTSEGLFVYGDSVAGAVSVGDVVRLGGRVKEYRSSKDFLYVMELAEPEDVEVVASGRAVRPLVVGRDTAPPPTGAFSGLDAGGVLGVPNGVARMSEANPALDPAAFGLDFWESLAGELVTVRGATAVGRPNRYGDVWVRGDWAATGVNGHGGLTMLDGDANPEAVLVGAPLDGTANPADAKMGDYVGDVTGVVTYAHGFYRLLPLTALAPRRRAAAGYPDAALVRRGGCRGLAVAADNAENLAPGSAHLEAVAAHVAGPLRAPDLVFLQEVQDGSGPRDDGVTSANGTLAALAAAVERAAGVAYDFADVEPVDGANGGQPGGSIRCAYLFRPDTVRLHGPRRGGSLDAAAVDGPALSLNPGRVDPAAGAFAGSRKPVAAMWETVGRGGAVFFTVNVHFGSKGGSTTLHGDARPPVNKGVEKRTQQAAVTAAFVAQILAKDPEARVVAAGDFNEFAQVEPVRRFAADSGLVDADDAAGLAAEERYTYLFDMNSEALDHVFVSPALARRGVAVEHLHLNTWQPSAGQTSDHEPTLALLDVCA